MNPLLSIIIPAFNRKALLDLALRALLRTVAEAALYELIVVDDGSTDGTAEHLAAAFQTVRCVRRTKNIGKPNNPGLARNCGIRAARGQWVAMLDCDIFHCHDIIAATLAHLRPGFVFKAYGHCMMERDYHCATEIDFECRIGERLPGQFWTVVERQVLQNMGGFDERFTDYGAEDQDLMARLTRLGLSIADITGQFAVGLYASRGIPGGVLDRDKNTWQHHIAQTDKSIVRNVGVNWGEPA